MSVNFNQTNLNATTSFFGAGGSNFPSGISVGSSPPFILKNGGDAVDALQVQNTNTSDNGYIQIGGAQINPNGQNGLQLTPTSINGLASNTYNLTPFMSVLDPNFGTSAFALSNISSMSGTYIANNTYHTPLRLNLNPANANINDQIAMVVTYNPDDAGSTAIALGARGDGNAFVGAVWEGYITMPLDIWGAQVHMYSDNETFMFMDGKAGNIGSISTGVGFISGSNQFSSVMSADTQNVANMDALLSTLKNAYPNCFL
jgi:hypothetical protein